MKKILLMILFLSFMSEAYALPVSYDLRNYGRITSVKAQGIPGPCWAFAAIGAMESNYLTQNPGKKAPDLSEMQIAFYSYRDPKPERNFTSQHKSGTLSLEGNIFMPVALMSRLSGVTDEKILPYNTNLTRSERLSLAKKSPESFKRSIRLRDAYFLSGAEKLNEALCKELIMQHGAIAISMYSDVNNYHAINNFYTYYNPEHGTKINHLVVIAGWDDNFSCSNFRPKPSRDGAWLIKNSWGTLRGTNGGYFWLSYDQHIYGGTAFIVEKNNTRLKHYGYDDLGWCSSANYSWGANVFRIESEREKLKEASFYTTSNNTGYELYIYDLGKNFSSKSKPNSGKLISSVKGRIEYSGYHTINLPERILIDKGNYFSVVLKLSNNRMPVETKIKGYSDNAAINEHESYFSRDGKNWTDGINIKSNACIKAFTITK